MAQIKVGSELKEPKSVNVYRDGEWRKKQMGYVYHNGEWLDIIKYRTYIFEEGTEHISIGLREYSQGYEEVVVEDDYLYVGTKIVGSYTAEAISEKSLDLTEYNTIYFEAKKESNHTATLGVGANSDEEDGRFGDLSFDASKTLGANYTTSRTVYDLDISDLTGDYYIKINFKSTNNTSGVYIYNIWIE